MTISRKLKAMVGFITSFQDADGNWRSDIRRPPLEASDFTATALSLRSSIQDSYAAGRNGHWGCLSLLNCLWCREKLYKAKTNFSPAWTNRIR